MPFRLSISTLCSPKVTICHLQGIAVRTQQFLPSVRLHLPTASQYFRNWQRLHRPKRAVPLSWDLLGNRDHLEWLFCCYWVSPACCAQPRCFLFSSFIWSWIKIRMTSPLSFHIPRLPMAIRRCCESKILTCGCSYSICNHSVALTSTCGTVLLGSFASVGDKSLPVFILTVMTMPLTESDGYTLLSPMWQHGFHLASRSLELPKNSQAVH